MGEKLGGKSRKKEGGDGKRRKGEKVGQFIHVCAAQTVDNGTEVDGRPTTLLMEQMKCGLTTRWLSHGMAPDSRHALKTLKQSFNHSHCSFLPFICIEKFMLTAQAKSVFLAFLNTEMFHASILYKTHLASSFKTFLVLGLFVGCIFAYLLDAYGLTHKFPRYIRHFLASTNSLQHF